MTHNLMRMMGIMKAVYITILTSLALTGCGGGGGGGGSAVVKPTPASFETTEYNAQYGLGKIKASEIYSDGYSGSGVTVAVLDTGVDLDHPDLIDNIASGGYDYVDNDSDANPNGQGDYMSHGTHVAGTIAGMKNETGMHGVAYGAKILSLRNGISSGSVSSSATINAYSGAISKGAKVINNSYIFSSFSSAGGNKLLDARTNDIVQVWAAGNDSESNPRNYALAPNESGYEDLADSLIAVVATDSTNTIAGYSNKCGVAKNWCMAAPGTSIYSTVDTTDNKYSENYATMSGASMATPHVSGAVAVLRSKWPSKTAAQIVTILYDTATDLGAAGIDTTYGRGLLNLDNAVFAQGSLNLYSPSGSSYSLEDSDLNVSSIVGNALNKSIKTAVYDKYKRDYYYNLDGAIVSPGGVNLLNELKYDSEVFTVNQPGFNFYKKNDSINVNGQVSDYTLSYSRNTPLIESLSLMKNKVDLNMSSNFSLHNATHLSQVDSASTFGISKSGNVTVGAGVLSGFIDKDKQHSVNGFSLSALTQPTDGLSVEVQLNQLNEKDTFLSNYFSGAYQTGNAKTNSVSLTAASELGGNFDFIAQASKGRTGVDTLSNSVVSNITTVDTSGYSLALIKNSFTSKNDKAYFSIKQPLKVDSGDLTLRTANGLNADDSISFIDQSVSLKSADSEKVYTLGYSNDNGDDSKTSILVNYKQNPSHDSNTKDEYQTIAKWSRKF